MWLMYWRTRSRGNEERRRILCTTEWQNVERRMEGIVHGVIVENRVCNGMRRRWERDHREAEARISGSGNGKYLGCGYKSGVGRGYASGSKAKRTNARREERGT